MLIFRIGSVQNSLQLLEMPYFCILTKNSYIVLPIKRLGEPRTLLPNQAISRGEVAALFCRALEIPQAPLANVYPTIAAATDRPTIFQQFLQQEEGFDAQKLAFLDRGIARSPYQSALFQYPRRLRAAAGVQPPLKKASTYPLAGDIFFVNERSLEFLAADILSGCVCLSTVRQGKVQASWLGRDALGDCQMWSLTKFVPLLNVAARANAIAPITPIDRYWLRAAGSSAKGYPFSDLAAGIMTYDSRIATSNSLAVMFKNLETPARLKKWTQQLTGSQSLSFQRRYGEVPFIEFPELWNPQTQQIVLKASGEKHQGQNLLSTYNLTRLLSMAAWHWQLHSAAKIPGIQRHSLESIVRTMGLDTARYVNVALETLGLSALAQQPVIISKSGFGRSDQRDRTELTYCALVQLSLPRTLTGESAPDPTASHQQHSLCLSLIAAKGTGDADEEACDDDTGSRYLEGFVKTSRRRRRGLLQNVIWPALFKSVMDLKGALRDIHLNRNVQVQGDASALSCSDLVIKNAKLLRELLDRDGLEKTLMSFPTACSEYPRLIRNHLKENYKKVNSNLEN